MRVFAQDFGHFLGERNRALLPIFRQKSVLGFCSNVGAPMCKIQVRPMERLELPATKSSRKGQREECPLPVVAHSKKLLKLLIGVGDWAFAKFRQPRNVFDRVVDA